MFENIRLSFRGIFSHKVRSILTMLGIIIGIAAIIAIVSTIKGTNDQIKDNLIGSGNNTVSVVICQGEDKYDMQYQSVPDGIPVANDEVKEEILKDKNIEAVSLYRERISLDSIYYKNNHLSGGNVTGIDEDYLSTAGYAIREGKGFSENNYRDYSKVALIDSQTKSGIFAGENPIGKIIDINGEPFKVIGVVEKLNKFQPVINSYEDYQLYNQDNSSGQIFIPTDTWPIVFRYDEPQNCLVKAINTDSMTKAGNSAEKILNSRLSVSDDTIKYKSQDQLKTAESIQSLSSSTNTLVICIAGISLLVGGIGVMNIMLVSVTERTREIGLKKALGARKKTILGQFLTEAAVLTSVGGIIGIITGIILAQIIAKFAEVPVSISVVSIIISVVFSMAVGIIFGFIPSVKASNLDPIEALRYE